MLQKAIMMDPNNGEAHVALANFYCSPKNGKRARAHFEKALEAGVQIDPQLTEKMKTGCH